MAKQKIIGSILAEKLVLKENHYRAIKLKGIVSLICRPGKNFKGSKNKESSENSELSNLVPETGFEPARRFQRHHLKVVRLPISPPGQP